MQKLTKAELAEVLQHQQEAEECAWCHGPLPPFPHAREGRFGDLFCSGTCERKYECDVLGIE